MAEVAPLPLNDITCKSTELVNAMQDPERGMALVVIDANPRYVLEQLVNFARIEPGASENAFAHCEVLVDRGYNILDGTVPAAELGDALQRELVRLTGAFREVLDPVSEAFDAPLGTQRFSAYTVKRLKLTDNHVDWGTLVNVWLGASKPGLQVLHSGSWYAVDAIPPNTALIWRGDSQYSGDLPAQRHRVNYRRVARRAILSSFDLGPSAFSQ